MTKICIIAADDHSVLIFATPFAARIEKMADVELVAMIETHLKMCDHCRTTFLEAYSDVSLDQLTKADLRLGPLLPTFAVALSPTGY